MKKIAWILLLALLFNFVSVFADCIAKPTAVLHPVKVKGKWGFIDSKGKLKVKPQFDEALEFSEGMAAVKLKNRWGFIDQSGKITIKPQFENVESFHEGFAFVVYDYSLVEWPTAFIDKKGNKIFDPKQRFILHSFNNGIACFVENHKFYETLCYIDKKGNVLDEKTVYASVSASQYEYLLKRMKCKIQLDISKGDNIIDPDLKEGLARVWIPSWNFCKWGYVDSTGNMVIEPKFSYAGNFSEGIAVAKLDGVYEPSAGFYDSNKVGYIDKTGKTAIEPLFDFAEDFNNGIAEVCIVVDGNYNNFKIDKTGKKLSDASDSSTNTSTRPEPANESGLIAISTPYGYGFNDANGNTVVPPQFADVQPFHEGLAAVKTGINSGKWGFVDNNKKIVVPAQYDDMNAFSGGLAAVRIGPKWGYIDKTGKVIIKPQFDTASDFLDGIAKVTINDMVGYINKKGVYVWKLAK